MIPPRIIEVVLSLQAINKASARTKSISLEPVRERTP